MSRYAFEWAKAQRVDAEAKTVLLVLGHEVQGPNHLARYYDDRIVREAALAETAAENAIERLVAAGLLSCAPAPDSRQPGRLIRDFRLLIPSEWRTQAAHRPKREPFTLEAVPTAVYRLYDPSGCLLYIGISDQPEERFAQHALSKPWWPDVVTRELHWYYDLPPAVAEEERAIAAEQPLYNIENVGSTPPGGKRARKYVVTNGRHARLEALVRHLASDIRALKYDTGSLPEHQDLAQTYSCDTVLIQQAINKLLADGLLEVDEEAPGIYHRPWA